MLFRMVPKQNHKQFAKKSSFRAVLFRMVPKRYDDLLSMFGCFRAVLFRMVPKLLKIEY